MIEAFEYVDTGAIRGVRRRCFDAQRVQAARDTVRAFDAHATLTEIRFAREAPDDVYVRGTRAGRPFHAAWSVTRELHELPPWHRACGDVTYYTDAHLQRWLVDMHMSRDSKVRVWAAWAPHAYLDAAALADRARGCA